MILELKFRMCLLCHTKQICIKDCLKDIVQVNSDANRWIWWFIFWHTTNHLNNINMLTWILCLSITVASSSLIALSVLFTTTSKPIAPIQLPYDKPSQTTYLLPFFHKRKELGIPPLAWERSVQVSKRICQLYCQLWGQVHYLIDTVCYLYSSCIEVTVRAGMGSYPWRCMYKACWVIVIIVKHKIEVHCLPKTITVDIIKCDWPWWLYE